MLKDKQTLQQSETVNKEHYKMYKAGKQWLFAAIFVATVGGGTILDKTNAVSADTEADTSNQSAAEHATAGNSVTLRSNSATATNADTKSAASSTSTDTSAQTQQTKTVQRTVNFVDANGQQLAAPVVQQVKFTRANNSEAWQYADGDTGYASVAAPAVAGLTPDSAVAAVDAVSATDEDSTVTIRYTESKTTNNTKTTAADATSSSNVGAQSSDEDTTESGATTATTGDTTKNSDAATNLVRDTAGTATAEGTDVAADLLSQLPTGTQMSQIDGVVTYALPESANMSAVHDIVAAANPNLAIKLTQTAPTVKKQATIGDVSALQEIGTAVAITDPNEISDNFVLNTKTGKTGVVKSSANDVDSANYIAVDKDDKGYVVLTTTGVSAGSYAYQNLIDTTKSFTISGGFETTVASASGSVKNASSSGGGGLGIVLQGTNPSSAGLTASSNPGANLGIATDGAYQGVSNATFAGFDANIDATNDKGFKTGLVLIRQTNAEGVLTDLANSAQAPSTVGGGQAAINSKFVLSWIPDGTTTTDGRVNGKLTLAMYSDAAHTNLLQQTSLATSLDAASAIAAFGSFGGLGSDVGVRAATIDSLNLTAATANITVKYLTDSGSKLSPDQTVGANVGTTLTIGATTDVENDIYAPTVFNGYTFWKAVGTVSGDNTVNAINTTYAGANSANANDITLTYVKSAELGNLDNEATVQTAQSDLEAALADTTDSNSANVLAAQTALSSAVDAANDARIKATAAAALVSVPKSVSNEPFTGTGVSTGATLADAQSQLSALVLAANSVDDDKHASATNDAITAATVALQSAITNAVASRNQSVNAAKAALAAGKGYNYEGNVTENGQQSFVIISEMKDLGAKLNADVAASATGTVATAQISADTTAFTAIMDQIDAAADKLQNPKPFQLEPEVIRANDQLTNIDMHSTVSLADFLSDMNAVNAAINSAATARTAVEQAGAANIQAAKDAGVDATPVLAAAVKSYQDNVTAAAAGTVATADEQVAAAKIKTVMTAVVDANSAIAVALAAGVDNETVVSTAITELNKLLNSDTATPEALAAATSTVRVAAANAVLTRTPAKLAASADNTDITSYKNETTKFGAIAELKQQLDNLVAASGDATNANHAGATTAAITAATTTLTNAIDAVTDARKQVTDAGDAAVADATTKGLNSLTLVANAINAYQQAVIAANGGAVGSSTAAIDDAVKRLQAIVAAGQVSNEPAVFTAISKLNTSGLEDTQTAIDALTVATAAAEAERDAAKTDGATTIAAIPVDVATATGVAAAVTDYNQLVQAADQGQATTSDIWKASAAINAAVAENAAVAYQQNPEVSAAQAALDAALADVNGAASDVETATTALNAAVSNLVLATTVATNMNTAPYSKDADVMAAKSNLDKLVGNSASATSAITDAVAALKSALDIAKNHRETVEKAGTDLVDVIGADLNLSGNPEVKQARDAYDTAVSAATNDQIGTDAEQSAVAALDAAVKAVTNARSAANAVVTSPYSQDQSVKDAQKFLDDLISLHASTAQAIATATTALKNAVEMATIKRSEVEAKGVAVATSITSDNNLNQNTAVLAARDAYNTAVLAADNNAGSTETEQTALNTLTAAIDAVNNARMVANAVVTNPYSKDTLVAAAQKALDDLLQSPVSTAELINDATASLKNAVTTATATRSTTEANGKIAQEKIDADINLQNNGAVTAALDSYTAAVSAAGANDGSTEAEQAALTDLNTAITAVENARSSAAAVITSPYSQDLVVQTAQNKLNILIADPTSTATAVATAVTALKDAVTTAQKARNSVEQIGKDVSDHVTTEKTLNQNPDVQTALTAYNDTVTAAGANTGSTETEQNALTDLNKAISAVETARQSASNLVTNPYSQDAVVLQAQAVLDGLIDNPASSAAAITTAVTGVENAVITAKAHRDQIEKSGTTITEKIAATANLNKNPEVVAAQDTYATAVSIAAANTGSTEAEELALSTLNTIVTALENARESAVKVATSPYSQDELVRAAQKVLDDALDNQTSSAALISDAKIALENAVATATRTRNQVEASGAETTSEIAGDVNLNQNSEVKAAQRVYDDAVTAAADNVGNTEAESTALAALNTAVSCIKNARMAASQVITKPYSLDATVVAAKTKLDQAIADPTSSAAVITDAAAALETAVATAAVKRDQVEASGLNTIDKIAGDANLKWNAEVLAAQAAYTDAVTAAADNTGNTETEKTTLDILNATIAALETARVSASAVMTSPYSQDAAVKAAQAKLTAVLDEPTSAATAITDATTALENAVATATATRSQIEASGKTTVEHIAGISGLERNPDIVTAQKVYTDAVIAAAGNIGSTEDETAALEKLNTVVATIENTREAAANIKTSPYSHDAIVETALTNLKNLTDDQSSSVADITAAQLVLENAVTTAQTNRTAVENNGTKVLDAMKTSDFLPQNPDVQRAEDDYLTAVNNGANDAASTEDIQAALDKLNAAVVVVQNARTAASAVETSPYSLDADVATAKNALAVLIASPSSTADAIIDARKTLENAVAVATKTRQVTEDIGTTVTNTIDTTDNLRNNPDVQQAEVAYRAAVAKGTKDNASTAEIQAALDKMNAAVAAVENARTSAATVMTSPYSLDDAVQTAKNHLDQLLKATTSTADALNTAKIALADAVTTAAKTRTAVEANGSIVMDKITKIANLQANPEVQQAQADYQIAITNAVNDMGSTEDIQLALDKMNAAVAAIENARTAADAVQTSPYSLDTAVQIAKDNLNKLMTNPASTADAIYGAKTALGTALTTAKATRDSVETDGKIALDKVADDPNLAQNNEIKAAQSVYTNAVNAAAADTGSTEAEQVALTNLNAAITAVATARDAASKVQTNPYSRDAVVVAAQNALATALNNPESSAVTISTAVTAVKTAVATATTARANVESAGALVTNQITHDDNLAKNADVQAAKDVYDEAVNVAANDTGSTEQEQVALNKLNAVIVTVNNARVAASKVTTNPYSQDTAVKDAKKVLTNLLASPESSAAAIDAAVTALENSVTAAKTSRDTVEASGQAVNDHLTANPSLLQNTDIQAAQAAYKQAVIDAGADRVGTESEQAALDRLNAAVTAVENARSAADNVSTNPYSQDTTVKDAKQALTDLIADPASTAAAIDTAVTTLKNAISAAKSNRDDVEASGQATRDHIDASPKLLQNADVYAAQAVYMQAVADAAADKVGTEAERSALNKLNAAVTAIENAWAAADNVATSPYSYDTAVKDAKQTLTELLGNPASSAAAIDTAVTVVENAVTTAASKRTTVEDKGRAVNNQINQDPKLKKNPDIQAALQDYNFAVAEAAADTGSTEAEQTALDSLQAVITDAEAARAAAGVVVTSPYSQEEVVKTAKGLLDSLKDDLGSISAAFTAAKTAINNAVTIAKTARDAVEASGSDLKQKISSTATLNKNADVQAAQSAYDDAVAAAAGDTGSTEAEQTALNKLSAAIADIEAARAAGTVVTAPYSEETTVKADKAALQELLADASSSATAITNATTKLQTAVAAASRKRSETVAAGLEVTKSAAALALYRRADVALAIAQYKDAVARAADDKDVTQSIQKAIDDLQAALNKIEVAIATANATTGAEVAQEPAVVLAQNQLNQLLKSDSTATAVELETATDKLQAAVTTARAERENVTTSTDTRVTTATQSGIETNDEVAAAIKAYQDAKDNAASGRPDAATTATVKDAADNLQAVISQLTTAIDRAQHVVTAPVSQDASVVAAQAIVTGLLASENSSSEDLRIATEILQNTVADAQADRVSVLATGDQLQESIRDKHFATNLDVATARQNYLDVQTRAANDQASTADLLAGLMQLQDVVTSLTTAVNAAQAVVSAPVAQEAAVINAQMRLDNVLADPSTTAAVIQKATADLQSAIAQAQTEREQVEEVGAALQNKLEQSGYNANPEVAAALQSYTDVLERAQNNLARTEDENRALTELQKIVDTLQLARDAAATVKTGAYAKDASVRAADSKLQDLLKDTRSTAAVISAATQKLQSALKDATSSRTAIVKQGNHLGNELANVAGGQKLISKYAALKQQAANGQASTADLQATVAQMRPLLTSTTKQIIGKKAAGVKPAGQTQQNSTTTSELPQLGDAGRKLSVAGVLSLAVVSLFTLLGLGKKRKEDE
jgi:hypothetical protein